MKRPAGTITFLFTDIEGSTRLWDQHPEAMRSALARHDALLKKAIESHNGTIFKTMGDAFCAAFSTAPEALSAAQSAQQALRQDAFPEVGGLRVRMALHTGVAEVRKGDYFGPPLNRVARLLSIGHGGQVLLSLPAEELVRDHLPKGVGLKPLGSHRLRDLSHPEQVFQLLAPDLPDDFPALKSLDHLPNNLPLQLSSFIGREQEMAEVKNLLANTRLLTLTGSGGSGKTRLALQVAADLCDLYPDGLWLVELASITDPQLVPQTVATALGIREIPGHALFKTLVDSLQPKTSLLLLDNCEHLLDACAGLADTLLKSCPNVCILATSREGLGLTGEQTVRVPSLSLPESDPHTPLEQRLNAEAVRLFADRARLSLPSFRLTEQNADACVQICRRLDGIPLAIELAAARVKAMPVEQIAARLDDRFRLLVGGNRMAMPRQQTLRALIDWSYDLLTAKERTLLHRLAVFAGGWTLEAAEQVCAFTPHPPSNRRRAPHSPSPSSGEGDRGGEGEWEVLNLLTSLVEKSLALYDENQARYRLLESVRQYAREKLMESGEAEAIRTRHSDYFVAFVAQAAPELSGADNQAWSERLEQDHDNIRMVLEWLQTEDSKAETVLKLAGEIARFWYLRGYNTEGRKLLAVVLTLPGAAGRTLARARALNGAAILALNQTDNAAAHKFLTESLEIYQELGDKTGISGCLHNLGMIACDQSDYDTARTFYEQSLAMARELGNQWRIAAAFNNLGVVAIKQGDYATARARYEEGLAICRELQDKGGIARALGNLANILSAQGEDSAAIPLYEECLALFRELGDRASVATTLANLGNLVSRQQDHTSAKALQEESLAIMQELGNRWGIAQALSNLADIACRQGDDASAQSLCRQVLVIRQEVGDKRDLAFSLEAFAELAKPSQPRRAARLLGAANVLRERIHSPLEPRKREAAAQRLDAVRVALGPEAFEAAWAEGQAMSTEEAIAYALQKEYQEA